MSIGYLFWWRVGSVALTHDELEAALAPSGAKMPTRPIPVDVYRRLTRRTWADTGLTLSLEPVKASTKLIHHHIVATVREAGAVQEVLKVGEATFYVPPRQQHSKARARFATVPSPFIEASDQFVQELRHEYDKGVKGSVDGQTVRRAIRSVLGSEHFALYLDGPYFTTTLAPVKMLQGLFDLLGEDSLLHAVPIDASPANAQLIARGLSRAVSAGTTVPEDIWAIPEEAA